MNKTKIVAVSYINTYPFIYGIENSGILNNEYELYIENPAICADWLKNNKADVGLVPVAVIPELKQYEIISDYCIGASANVRSVVLLSNSRIENINKIYLDYQSRTSILLVRVLAKFYWNIEVLWQKAKPDFEKNILLPNEGMVLIGDRVFNEAHKYKYVYDLAGEWNEFTGLPFVFACWVSINASISSFADSFNNALEYGVNHIKNSLEKYNSKNYNINLENYLKNNIDYNLNEEKLKGMDKFFTLIKKLNL
ncbi:MAG: menaquinone biosynthesis protein [Chlorobi bacterium]|nr:menaquinone biosynthesis protein [Chlorobiota bacterium]